MEPSRKQRPLHISSSYVPPDLTPPPLLASAEQVSIPHLLVGC